MAKRNHLDSYRLDWYGPGGHESHRKMGGLHVLSQHISDALRKTKVETNPAAHEIWVQFSDDDQAFRLFQRQPKTVWLNWVRDYRELEALPFDADATTVAEFSIRIAHDLMAKLRTDTQLIEGFPFRVVEGAIETFRQEDYTYTSRLSPYVFFDASPLEARFFTKGDCLSTTVKMIFYLNRKELHRRKAMTFGPGAFGAARHVSNFDLYDNEIKLLSMDMTREAPVIRYDELPEEVRCHLPSNEELHAEWGTPYDPHSD